MIVSVLMDMIHKGKSAFVSQYVHNIIATVGLMLICKSFVLYWFCIYNIIVQDECLAASRNNILDSLCLPHQRCLQRAVMHQVCVCPPFTLKYRGYTAAPECIGTCTCYE